MEVDATWDTVTMQGVEKRLGRHQVFSRVSLTAGVGSVLGLIGANGSGKTTLLRLLLGLIRPDSGCIRLYGLPPHLALRHRRAVYFAGGASLPPTVRVATWARLFDPAGPLTKDRRRIGTLSRGQRQFVGLRCALGADDSSFVALDEPWSGLDPRGAAWLTDRLRSCRDRGAIVVVSSHRLDDLATVCDRYGILHAGQLTVRSGDDLRATAPPLESLRATYRELTTEGTRA